MKLDEDEIAVLYYYHVDSSIKYTKAMQDAYTKMVQRVKDEKNKKKKAPTDADKIWEAMKGVL